MKTLLHQVIDAADRLLAKRYRDGECDSVALSQFADEVGLVKKEIGMCSDCPHNRIITQPGSETFLPRRGCLDCNEWLEPVRLVRP